MRERIRDWLLKLARAFGHESTRTEFVVVTHEPMPNEKLEQCLAVSPDTPLLKGVQEIIRRCEQHALVQAMHGKIPEQRLEGIAMAAGISEVRNQIVIWNQKKI